MWEVLLGLRARDLVDIAIIAFLFYRLLLVFRGTLALQMLAGLGVLMAARFVSHEADLHSLSFVLDNFWAVWVLVLVVLFQPELRRVLARTGQSRPFRALFGRVSAEQRQLVDEIARAVEALAAKRVGALVAIERQASLDPHAELGVRLEALVSAELLGSIFQPGSPLHDGAAVVQGDRVMAAGCFLPLSRNLALARTLGTRHRAALGLSEETDAVVVVVSEETGTVSLAVEGVIERGVAGGRLATRLGELLGAGEGALGRPRSLWAGVRRYAPRTKG